MAVLFSAPFMKSFMEAWNSDAEMSELAAAAGLSAVMGYGFDEDAQPSGVITVKAGRVTAAGAYGGETLDADLRATGENWQKWLQRPLDAISVGTALTTRQIANRRGDLTALCAEPAQAQTLVRSFILLAAVEGGRFTLPVSPT